MKILLTNDDGYMSVGLMLMCEKLAENHEVYVVAPDGQRSAYSHMINFHRDIKFMPLDGYCNAAAAYISSGTPADCVKFAERQLGVKFDLLISGPNNGENYGSDILYSGTVGAAEEGVICGIKSIAVSRLGFGGSFASAVQVISENLDLLTSFDFADTLLNINVPDLPYDEIKGIRVTSQGGKLFNNYYEKAESDNHWRLEGTKLEMNSSAECDVSLSENGYVTVTPLCIFQTNEAAFKIMKSVLK